MAAKSEIKIPEMDLETAKKIVAETNFLTWPTMKPADIMKEANLFRAAFVICAAAEAANEVDKKKNPSYIAELDAYNAKFPFLAEYRAGLKKLDEKYGTKQSETLAVAKAQYNGLTALLKNPAWGNLVLPTITTTGEIRKAKGEK